ncbi:glycoside hydrolase family 127 protein, partial [Mesorhizobium sp. M7A.F.Ca.CA.004.05.1.1]
PRTATIEAQHRPELLGGVVTLSTAALADAADGWRDGLYRPEPPATAETRLTAIPYFAWDNREPGEMLVWLRDG